MIKSINKFKIPTILGLGIIAAGIASGIFLSLKDQTFLTKASPDMVPQNITISNIEDTSVTISWQTSAQTSSFVTFGTKNPQEQTVLDERDTRTPEAHSLHYVTIKNLQPDSKYLFKITSGKQIFETQSFKTASIASFQNGFGPIIGTVLYEDKPLDDGIVYLSISDANVQSARLKDLGNFLIPISLIRKADLSDTFQLKEGGLAKLTIISDGSQSSVLFKLDSSGTQLPPIKLGQNIDLTNSQAFNGFDLNEDGNINAIDYSIILQNFGKNPRNKKTDLNRDGIVDNQDLEEMSRKIQRKD